MTEGRDLVMVWSGARRAWWIKGSGGEPVYTADPFAAGVWDRREARRMTDQCPASLGIALQPVSQTPHPDARSVLATMMKELATDNWPSDTTWADACRVVGRPVPAALPVSADLTAGEQWEAIINPQDGAFQERKHG